MPIRWLRVSPEMPLMPQVLGPPPTKIKTMRGSVEDFRRPAPWHLIMDRSYHEAAEKLGEIVMVDMGVTEQVGSVEVPCIIELKEARTMKEEEYIRRAHKTMAKVFSGFVDKLVRYNPESYPYAFDALKQEIFAAKPLWAPYECSDFRPKEEVDGQGGKKKRHKQKTS